MSLRPQIDKINTLGRNNLNAKGVTTDGNETTYQLMNMISSIQSGGESVVYSNIVYNDDNTITFIDDKGNIHTMSCVYEGDRIVSISYDGENVDLEFNGETLVNVGGTQINVSKAPVASGGNTELNIAYGDTEPDDTSKLWIKANEPESIVFGKDFEGVGSLETISNLPSACYGMGCASVGNKVYLFGGNTSSTKFLKTINVFDIKTQTLTTLSATIPNACRDMGCASVGNKVYLFGGYYYSSGQKYLSTIYEFDTETETLTKLGVSLPFGYCAMGCASVGNKIYLFGGYYYSSGNPRFDTIRVFDTETQTLSTVNAVLPNACSSMGCVSVGNKIYLFGGTDDKNSFDTINVFDSNTETITTLEEKLPNACSSMGCINVYTNIYLFGCYDGDNPLAVLVFNTATQELSKVDTIDFYRMSCASFDNKIYLFGGYGSDYLNIINQYLITHELTQNNIEVITGSQNYFNIVNTDTMKVEIGINSVLIGNEENKAENCEAYLYQNDAWVQI